MNIDINIQDARCKKKIKKNQLFLGKKFIFPKKLNYPRPVDVYDHIKTYHNICCVSMVEKEAGNNCPKQMRETTVNCISGNNGNYSHHNYFDAGDTVIKPTSPASQYKKGWGWWQKKTVYYIETLVGLNSNKVG